MTTWVVTGASGFLGAHVCSELAARGHDVRALVRREVPHLRIAQVHYEGLHDSEGIQRALEGVSAVVHLAARVHMVRDESTDPLGEFRRVNVDGTHTLGELAARAGVSEFFFASSVKAMGETNTRPWTEADPPSPGDPYGISKLEAELALADVGSVSGMATVPLRLPLVYGPGVRANMLRLFRLVDRGWLLPLGSIDNRRSLVFAGNVAAAIALLLGRVRGHEVFLVSDGEDVSTTELIHAIGESLGRRPRLMPAPVSLADLGRRIGVPILKGTIDRLFGSLTIDASKLRDRIGEPLPYTLRAGLGHTARWYRRNQLPAYMPR